MKNSFLLVIFSCLVSINSSTYAACVAEGAVPLPLNTKFSISGTVYNYIQAAPNIANTILAARDGWDKTDAKDRVGDWDEEIHYDHEFGGSLYDGDCPSNTNDFQLGMLPFNGSTCQTIIDNGADGSNGTIVVAMADEDTMSVLLSLNHAWSISPSASGERDIQSYLTHEFGHVLGLEHNWNGICVDGPSPTCVSNPNRSTMDQYIYDGPSELCNRSIEVHDKNAANQLY